MGEITANVNWLAVVIGAVLAFALGWLWYSPALFGAKWAEGVGVKLGSADGMPVGAMVVQAVGTFLLAWAVGVLAASNAPLTFVLVVLTIVVLMFAGGLFARKSMYAIYTETGFVIAMAVVMFASQMVL